VCGFALLHAVVTVITWLALRQSAQM